MMKKRIPAIFLAAGIAGPSPVLAGLLSFRSAAVTPQAWAPFTPATTQFVEQFQLVVDRLEDRSMPQITLPAPDSDGYGEALERYQAVLGVMQEALRPEKTAIERAAADKYVTPRLEEAVNSAYREVAVKAIEEKLRAYVEEIVQKAARGRMTADALDRAANGLQGFGAFFGARVEEMAATVGRLALDAHAMGAKAAAEKVLAEWKAPDAAGANGVAVFGDPLRPNRPRLDPSIPDVAKLLEIPGLRERTQITVKKIKTTAEPVVFNEAESIAVVYFADSRSLAAARETLPRSVQKEGVAYAVFPEIDPQSLERERATLLEGYGRDLQGIPGVAPEGVIFDAGNGVFTVLFTGEAELEAGRGRLPSMLDAMDPAGRRYSAYYVSARVDDRAKQAVSSNGYAPHAPFRRIFFDGPVGALRIARNASAARGFGAGVRAIASYLFGRSGSHASEAYAMERRHWRELWALDGVRRVSFNPDTNTFRVVFADRESRRAAGFDKLGIMLPKVDPWTGAESSNGYYLQADILPSA